MTHPFGIYDRRAGKLVHIGLYESPEECWQMFLGWPSAVELDEEKSHGIVCVALTCTYDPPEEAPVGPGPP